MNPNLSMDTEQVCYGYNVTENITTEYALHCHNFYEVYLFLEGDVDYLVEGRTLQSHPPTACSCSLPICSMAFGSTAAALTEILHPFSSGYPLS